MYNPFIEKIDLNEKVESESYYQVMFKHIEHLSPEIYQIFEIARLLNSDKRGIGQTLKPLLDQELESEKIKEKSKVKEINRSVLGGDDWYVDGMNSLDEFPHILKKQFLLPDEVFDQKLLYKDLLITRTEKKEKRFSWDSHIEEQNELSVDKELRRQKTYILMDISKSTSKRDRLQLEKALIYSFLENNNKDKGEVFFRTFNNNIGPLFVANTPFEYKHLLNNGVITSVAEGQTNLQRALEQAALDIKAHCLESSAEILIVTDGLVQIDLEHCKHISNQLKINIVLIGDDEIHLTEKEVDEYIHKKFKKEYEFLEKTNPSALAEKKKHMLDRFHEVDKRKVSDEIETHIKSDLRTLCQFTEGLFIEVEDLPKSYIDYEKIIKQITNEISRIQTELNKKNVSPIEKERLLEQYFALKNYLNSLLNNKLVSKDIKDELNHLSGNMLSYIESSEEIFEMIKHSKLSMQFSMNDLNKMKDIGLFELFKLIFYKFKIVFLKRSKS